MSNHGWDVFVNLECCGSDTVSDRDVRGGSRCSNDALEFAGAQASILF